MTGYVSPYLIRASRRAQIDTMANVLRKRLQDLASDFPDPVEPSSPTSTGAAAVLISCPPEVS